MPADSRMKKAQNCPQILKGELKPFLTIFGTGMHARASSKNCGIILYPSF
jgi:hypothetical protein